jgi:hypothetical protein
VAKNSRTSGYEGTVAAIWPELRSTNAQIEFLLRSALADAGRLPGHTRPMRPRGRPRSE